MNNESMTIIGIILGIVLGNIAGHLFTPYVKAFLSNRKAKKESSQDS